MAAVCQLEHRDTGEKAWRYSVDAREILAAPGSRYRLTGNVKRSGWATPSGPRSRISAQVARTRSVGAEVARAVTEALIAAGVVATPQVGDASVEAALSVGVGEDSVEAPKGFEDGLPPDPDADADAEAEAAPAPTAEGANPLDLLS